MGCNAFGNAPIRRGGQHQAAAMGALSFQPRYQALVIRQCVNFRQHSVGEIAFETRFPFQKPCQHKKKAPGIQTKKQKKVLHQHVGVDERAIEINDDGPIILHVQLSN